MGTTRKTRPGILQERIKEREELDGGIERG